jgi:hypothetical protein
VNDVLRTKIVKTDMIPKDFVTLALQNRAEHEVLEMLLRTRSGFIVASFDADDPAAPRTDLLVIMPPSPAPPIVTAIAAPACPCTPLARCGALFPFTSDQMLVPPGATSTSPGSELPLEDF